MRMPWILPRVPGWQVGTCIATLERHAHFDLQSCTGPGMGYLPGGTKCTGISGCEKFIYATMATLNTDVTIFFFFFFFFFT